MDPFHPMYSENPKDYFMSIILYIPSAYIISYFSPKNNISKSIKYLKMPNWRWQNVAFTKGNSESWKKSTILPPSKREQAHILFSDFTVTKYCPSASQCSFSWRAREQPRGATGWRQPHYEVFYLPVRSQLTLCFPLRSYFLWAISTAEWNTNLTWDLMGKEEVSSFGNKVRLFRLLLFPVADFVSSRSESERDVTSDRPIRSMLEISYTSATAAVSTPPVPRFCSLRFSRILEKRGSWDRGDAMW